MSWSSNKQSQKFNYDLFISNSKLLSIIPYPPPHPPKNAHYLPVLLQVNFQMLKLAFPVSTSSSLSPLSTFTHWVLLLSYQWATKVIYTRLTFCLGQFTEGFHRPNVTQSNPTSDWASVHCLQNWCEQMIHTVHPVTF